MDSSKASPNWQNVGICLEELDIIDNYTNPQQAEMVARLREKVSKCRQLKGRLESDEKQLVREYMGLLVERKQYVGQLESIYELGNNIGWEVEVLGRIRPLIEATKTRLAEPKAVKSNQNS
jgi:hypothetical protein